MAKEKISEIKNKILQASTNEEFHATHLTIQDINWLVEQAENLYRIEQAWRNGSGENLDIALDEAFE